MPSKDALNDLRIAMGTPFGQTGSATPAAVPGSATPAAVPGSNQDPFWLSTGETKTVTINGKSYTGIDVGSTKPPAAGGIGSISPATGAVITGTERNAAKEAEARAIGYTKEYIAARGGINAQGYYNDVPLTGQLTAEEQKQVRLPNGNIDTAAMAKILQEKQIAELVSKGISTADATKQVSAGYGEYGIGGGSTGTGTGSSKIPTDGVDKLTKDAYALIEDTLNTYDLSSLAPIIKSYMLAGLGPEQAKLQIKQEPLYKARFKGNELRLASGLNSLSEAEYLGLEDTYSQVMKQYGLGDYFGTTRAARQTKLADVIGGDISAVELKSRISTVVDRVNNADPAIKAQLKEFYPGITETDLVKYFLDPKQTLPQLEEKVTSAEIGAAATAQGLNTNMTSASDLARYGIDRAAAIKGYSTIGGILPGAQKLSDIYGEAKIDYTQATAEQEVFKGNASAERKRKQLAALESAQFSGSAGVGTAGLSTTYLRKSSSGGQF
jgi:hypothetical protein